MGFTVVRPLRVRKAGRTVLPLAPDLGDIQFVTTPCETQINLAGVSLTAHGPPFIEQDERVSRCATAALWMASNAVAQRADLARFSTAEITQLATRFLVGERALPSNGLFPEQMAEALRAMGFDPIQFGFTDVDDAWANIYAYVESGIPPLLLFRHDQGQHVVTAVGHSWKANAYPSSTSVDWDNQPALEFHRSSSWVPSVLAHDDEVGPFVEVSLLDHARGWGMLALRYGTRTADALLRTGGIPLVIQRKLRHVNETVSYGGILLQMLVPNPPGVTLTAREAERKSARLIRTWFEIRRQAPPSNYVLRTFLARSNDFKAWVRNSKMHQGAIDLCQGKGMPRWLWITEVSTPSFLNANTDDDQLILGEVVIDATSSPWTPDFLAFHLIEGADGFIHTMLPGDRDAESAMKIGWKLLGEVPYPHLARHPLRM